MNCIQHRNPLAGFLRSHTPNCTTRHLEGEIEIKVEATHHRNVGHWCGNLCERCATELKDRKRVLRSGVEEGVFVDK